MEPVKNPTPFPIRHTFGNGLLEDIRGSIKRLTSMQNQNGVNEKYVSKNGDALDQLVHDFQLRKLQKEIEEEKDFLEGKISEKETREDEPKRALQMAKKIEELDLRSKFK